MRVRATSKWSRRLLRDLARAELGPAEAAGGIEDRRLPETVRVAEDEEQKRRSELGVVLPWPVGLMDGPVSALAPMFAAAFATRDPWNAFPAGLVPASELGSAWLRRSLANDGKLSGRGAPMLRGLVCGQMTVASGIGHTLPYLIPHFATVTSAAFAVVAVKLAAIAFIQYRYMNTPILSTVGKFMLNGALTRRLVPSRGTIEASANRCWFGSLRFLTF